MAATPPPWFGPAHLNDTCRAVQDWTSVRRELALISRKGRLVDAIPLAADGSEFRVSLAMRRPLPTGQPAGDPTDVWQGAYEWYFEIVYRADALPSELSHLAACFERRPLQFQGRCLDCFVFSRGYDLATGTDEVQRRQFLMDMEHAALQVKVQGAAAPSMPLGSISCRRASVAECAGILADTKALLLVGSGISGGTVAMGLALDRGLGVDRAAAVDGFVRDALQGAERLAEVLTKELLSPLLSTRPSRAHRALAALATARHWGVATTNSDLLLEHAGLAPVHLVTYGQVEALLSPEALRGTGLLLAVGVGADHKGAVRRFREAGRGGRVLALVVGEMAPYLRADDWLLEGDVQETLPQLAEALGVVVEGAQ